MEDGGEQVEAVPNRRKRPDRAAKLRARKERAETVVKACLLKLLRGDRRLELLHAIRERVRVFSLRFHLASVALSGLLKRCFDGVADVAQAQLPDLADQTFFRHLMLGVDGARLPDPHVRAYYRDHPELVAKLPTERHRGDSNIYSAGAKKYLTNFRNHHVTGFKARLGRFLKALQAAHGLSDDQRVWTLFRICGWRLPEHLAAVPQHPAMLEAAVTHRRSLGLSDDGGMVDESWLKREGTLPHLVRHAVLVCRYLEAARLPAFNLAPIARRGAHFVAIDTHVLHGLLAELRIVRDGGESAFVAMGAEHWGATLAVSRLAGPDSGREFTGTVDTDGVSVCAHFMRPRRAADARVQVISAAPRTRSPLADDPRADDYLVVGNDPGRANIWFLATQMPDGRTPSWRLTRSRYYVESGSVTARKQSETWQKALLPSLARLAAVSPKGTDILAHRAFLDALLDTHDELWAEYLKPRWARQRLRLHGGKKRAFATFLNSVAEDAERLAPGKPLVVAYGAAKFAPGGRGEVSVPTSRAYKECASRFRTVLVDEFRTTAVSAHDGTVLKQVWNERKLAAVRGLKWCGSTTDGKFVNRDLNAALNIRRCLVSPVRPPELCRIEGQGRLPTGIGRVIRR